jgi:chaperonin GroES
MIDWRILIYKVKDRMIAFKTLRPLLNRVIVRKAEAITKTKSGIILSQKADQVLNFGEVLAIGPGKTMDSGSLRPTMVAVGDTVLLPEYGGSKIMLGDEKEVYIYRDDDIMGTLHDACK